MMEISHVVKCELTIFDPIVPLVDVFKGSEKVCSHKMLYVYVYDLFNHSLKICPLDGE
jgi:hypothetical protein